MKYTKGDWKLRRHGLYQEVYVDTPEKPRSKQYTICVDIGRDENAHLLVAAADMYEALKDIIEQAEKTHLPIGADLADSIRVFGKQAIAKAEGKG